MSSMCLSTSAMIRALCRDPSSCGGMRNVRLIISVGGSRFGIMSPSVLRESTPFVKYCFSPSGSPVNSVSSTVSTVGSSCCRRGNESMGETQSSCVEESGCSPRTLSVVSVVSVSVPVATLEGVSPCLSDGCVSPGEFSPCESPPLVVRCSSGSLNGFRDNVNGRKYNVVTFRVPF